MIITIGGFDYECRTATKKDNKVTLYLGKYDEYGDEITSVFIDFPDDQIIGLEEISEPTQLDRIESQVAYLAMMTGNEDILEV